MRRADPWWRTIVAAAALLSACAGPDAARRLAATDAALARVEARVAAAQATVLLFTPWLPPAQAARLRALADAAARTLALARLAAGLAAKRAALAEADRAADTLAHAAGA